MTQFPDSLAGDLGLEPRTTESESAMLPITPIANMERPAGVEPTNGSFADSSPADEGWAHAAMPLTLQR